MSFNRYETKQLRSIHYGKIRPFYNNLKEKNAPFSIYLYNTHDELYAHMFKWRKESEKMYGYPLGMFYRAFPVYQHPPYLQYCLIPYYDRRSLSSPNPPLNSEVDQMVYDISYERILASYLDIYGRKRHRISLLVRYPHTMENEWKPQLKACAIQASRAVNLMIEPSMWIDPQLVLASCKPVAIAAFLQCLPSELQQQMTVEVIYRRG